MYKNNVILLSKVRRKYKKHYKRRNNNIIKCVVCGDKKSKFIKKQKAALLNNTIIRKCFKKDSNIKRYLALNYKMNDLMNKFLLAGDKFMPKIHLRQPGFTYSACGPFNKNKERIRKFKETGDSKYIYQNQLDKGCFQDDMAYGDFKDLAKRTAADKVLRNKAFNIAKDPNMTNIKED